VCGLNEQTGMIAVLGGTFDPVHYGHLRTAWDVHETFGFEEFRWMPAGRPPHRSTAVSDPDHRLAMLRLALDDMPEFSIDTREISRPGPSYMVDSLGEIRASIGKRPLILVLGEDNACQLDTWDRWLQLFEFAHMVVMTRPDSDSAVSKRLEIELKKRLVADDTQLQAQPSGCVQKIPVTQLDISSSLIRAKIRAGQSARYLVPEPVRHYIEEHSLYL
jgi:nicotinate-nucleotide adenylyltransferase